MTQQAAMRWSVEGFAAFWAKPDPVLVPMIVIPDVTGHWPWSEEPVRGVAEYTQRIADVLQWLPGLHMEVAEHAITHKSVI
ncbi:MAG: hypothetical protein ACRETW_01690 [Stenotrophobium sp.]